MIRRFSLAIAWGCTALLIFLPLAAIFYLVDIDAFAALGRSSLDYPLRWETVVGLQWYGLWLITLLYVALGWLGLYFLRRAFASFAAGSYFTVANSQDLRWFSILLFLQVLTTPFKEAFSTIVLSLNHPPGQRFVSIMIGSDEIVVMFLAMLLWVISELLLKGLEIENENRQFV